MSRNLYKIIQKLEKRIDEQEVQIRLLQNEVSHLDTLLRLRDKIKERPVYPQQPINPWYKEPTLSPPYKITCEDKLEDDPFVKLMKETFNL